MHEPHLRDQEQLLNHLAGLCAQLRRALPTAAVPCFAYLRITAAGTGGRGRDVLLGWRTFTHGDVTLVNWQTAPLGEVFFAYQEGEEYELQVGGRLLSGTVSARSLLTFEAGVLVTVQTAGAVWSRRRAEDAQWTRSGTPSVLLLPRSAGAPRTPPPWSRDALDAEQRRAVDLPAAQPLLVLGEAGCGKTTVAVHRLAALQEVAQRAGRPFRALLLVPAASAGLRHLSVALLQRLGVTATEVEVEVFDRWAGRQARRAFPRLPLRESQDVPAGVVQIKRHPALLQILPALVKKRRRAAARKAGATRADLLHLFGDQELLEQLAAASVTPITSAAVHEVLEHTRVQFNPTTEAASAHVDAERLVTVDGRLIDDGTPMADAASIDAEDYAVLFALSALRSGSDGPAPTQYDCVVLDEAQEFAPIELLLIGRALRPGGTLIVAGDAAQQVDPSAYFDSFAAAMQALGGDDFTTVVLAVSYRCPPAVTALARTLRSDRPATFGCDFGRADHAVIRAAFHNECHLVARIIDSLRDLREADARASVAVICRTPAAAERMARLLTRGVEARRARDGDFRFAAPIEVTCVQEVKGLEFDYVIIPDPTALSYPEEPAARRALYVAVTRTSQQLLLAGAGSWTPLLTVNESHA